MLAFLPALLALAPQTVHVKPSNVRLVAQDKVTAPPAELVKSLKLSTFYAKYLDAEGFPILSSKNVPDAAFFECKRVLHGLFLKSPEARDQMVKNHVRLVIIGKDEVTTDVPEYKFLKNDKKTNWDTRARGLGATRQVPVVSCAEENVLAYPSDRYKGESILVHEFCHAIMDTGLVDLHPDFLPTLQKIYDHDKEAGLWKDTYAITNIHEFWAESCQDWFDTNKTSDPPNGIHNQIGTRDALKTYDSAMYDFVSKYMSADWKYVPPAPGWKGD